MSNNNQIAIIQISADEWGNIKEAIFEMRDKIKDLESKLSNFDSLTNVPIKLGHVAQYLNKSPHVTKNMLTKHNVKPNEDGLYLLSEVIKMKKIYEESGNYHTRTSF